MGQAEGCPVRSISVVIADRHPVVLQGLSTVLGAHSDFNIVASTFGQTGKTFADGDFSYDFGATIDAALGHDQYNYRTLDEYAAGYRLDASTTWRAESSGTP